MQSVTIITYTFITLQYKDIQIIKPEAAMEHPKELALEFDANAVSSSQELLPSLHASEGFNIAVAMSLGLIWLPAFFLYFISGWRSVLLYGASLVVVVFGTVFLRRPFSRQARSHHVATDN